MRRRPPNVTSGIREGMASDPKTSSTYMQRPYHGVLVCSVVICLVLVTTGVTTITWYTVTSRHDNESTSANATDGKLAPLVTGYDIQEVMQALWDNDVSRIPETDYVLNLQSKTNVSNKIDMADSSLFSNMRAYPQTMATTYRTFTALVDNYVATVRQADTPTMQQRQEIDAFLNAIVDTSVMQEAHAFLRYKGHAEQSRAAFKDLLYRVWFEPYSRSPRYNTTDSSGFEHVFVGEARRRKVIGFHSWLQFYLGEKDSTVDYRGYIRIQEPRLISVQFTWHGRQKRLAAFFVGTSPEFDMAVYTICLLTRPNKLCQFEINYFPVRVRTWDVSHVPGLQIGSAYPEL